MTELLFFISTLASTLIGVWQARRVRRLPSDQRKTS
jgi:hypothetical protein